MCIDLRRTAENNSVGVDNVNLAKRVERPENLRRHAGRIIHFIERDPLARVRSAGCLIKKNVGVLADVECLPVQQRLLLILHNRDVCFRAARCLPGQARALPQIRIGADTWRDLQSARR